MRTAHPFPGFLVGSIHVQLPSRPYCRLSQIRGEYVARIDPDDLIIKSVEVLGYSFATRCARINEEVIVPSKNDVGRTADEVSFDAVF